MGAVPPLPKGAAVAREIYPRLAVAYEDTLTRTECEELAEQLLECSASATEPYSPATGGRSADPAFAPSRTIAARAEHRSRVREAMERQRPAIEGFFGRPLELGADIRFLRYGVGAFIKPHVDFADGPDVPEEIRERSVVVTLGLTGNDGPEAIRHGGGMLELYIRLPEATATPALAGTLVAFDARVIHAVTEVTRGTRLAAVGWLRIRADDQGTDQNLRGVTDA